MSQSLFNEVEGSQPATDSDVSSGNHTFGSRAFGIDAQTLAPKKKKTFLVLLLIFQKKITS